MHRVKRPLSKTGNFGFSQVQYRTNHENPGDEPKTKTGESQKTTENFQLNAVGGPLGEAFREKG